MSTPTALPMVSPAQSVQKATCQMATTVHATHVRADSLKTKTILGRAKFVHQDVFSQAMERRRALRAMQASTEKRTQSVRPAMLGSGRRKAKGQ